MRITDLIESKLLRVYRFVQQIDDFHEIWEPLDGVDGLDGLDDVETNFYPEGFMPITSDSDVTFVKSNLREFSVSGQRYLLRYMRPELNECRAWAERLNVPWGDIISGRWFRETF